MSEKQKFPNIERVMYVNEKALEDTIDDAKNSAIKHIMRIVENNVEPESKPYKHIRSVVLDEINDVAREFKGMLDKILKD